MINIFSLFTKSDKINLDVSPILVKFNCILCKKTNTATIAYIETKGNVVFDIANDSSRTDTIWRSECAFCNAKNQIHFIVKHYEEGVENGKL